jgi:hypothetical protein
MTIKLAKIAIAIMTFGFMHNYALALDLSTSCAPVKTLSSTPTEMWVEITNQCGQCANISANYTFNGSYQAFAGTWNNVQPGGANKYRVPLDRGIGTYQVVVVKVEACN